MTGSPLNAKAVFDHAHELRSPAERRAYLDQACADAPEVREKVEGLLRAYDDAGSFLESSPPGLGTVEHRPAEGPGSRIGPYKLLEQLGEGGMGTVWMAEQREPIKRLIALKLIKPGMDSRAVLARFEAERQALALMDHPNIARVLDGGTTPEGRPYFIMELVKGLPLTEYCDDRRLSVRDRLDLFVQVCSAVQHAHQKGVIHRDLKPSNILVTEHDGKPVPKVIDFGLAKALHALHALTERTLYTSFGTMVGTPQYMAPEQVGINALDVDTRTDIYALGVILYELLTGTTPLEKKRFYDAAWDEMRRLIREEEAPLPSVRLSSSDALPSLAARRQVEPAKLSRLVRGDLDWIVLKSLEKDRNRRYETANGLAMDVQRHLADEPVLACPPSVTYRLHKFARKHRAGLVAVAAFAALLLLGVAVSTWQAIRATRAEQLAVMARDAEAAERLEAEQQRDKAQAARALADRNFQTARKAVEDYLQKVTDNPDLKNNPNSHDLRKQLLTAALPFFEEFVKEKSDDPAVRFDQAKAVAKLALLRGSMGERESASRDYTTARDTFARLAADFPAVPNYRRELARTLFSLGRNLEALGKNSEAEAELQRSRSILEKLVIDFPAVPEYRNAQALTLTALGLLLLHQSKLNDAEANLRQAFPIYEKLSADFPGDAGYRSSLAGAHSNLGMVLSELGKQADAEAAYRQAIALQENLAADFPTVRGYREFLATHHSGLAGLLKERGKQAEAEVAYRHTVILRERLAGDFPAVPTYRSDLAATYHNLGMVLNDSGKRADAERLFRQAVILQEKLVADFPKVPAYRNYLANHLTLLGLLLHDLRRLAEAEAAHRQAFVLREKLVAESPAVPAYRRGLAGAYNNLGAVLRDLGKRADAEVFLRQAIAVEERLVAESPAVPGYRDWLANHLSHLGRLLRTLGRLAEAEAALRKALALREKLTDDSPTVPAYRVSLASDLVRYGQLLTTRGQSQAALDQYAKAISLLDETLAQNSQLAAARKFLRIAYSHRATALRRLARYDEAVRECDRALALVDDAVGDGSTRCEIRLSRAAALLAQTGDHARAAAETEELTRGDKVSGDDLYAATGVLALASAAAKDDEKRRESYAMQAVALLRRARAANYFGDGGHVEALKTEPDLKALRARQDFQALVKELESKE